MASYSYFLDRKAFEFWRRQSSAARRRLSDKFDWLAEHPFSEGDGSEVNAAGIREFYSLSGPYVITHRPDHAICMVLIMDVASD